MMMNCFRPALACSRSSSGGGGTERTLASAVSLDDDETAPMTNATSHLSNSNHFPSLGFVRSSSQPTLPPPMTNMTGIGARLDAAIRDAKPSNRSADLVPLTQVYYKMKKQLKNLTNTARAYHSSLLEMDKARREIVNQFDSISANSPIHDTIGSIVSRPSLLSVDQAASEKLQSDATKYHQTVVLYLLEWKSIVTSRVDAGLEETRKLQETLFHYQSKVNRMRARVQSTEDRRNGKSPPPKMSEKLERNTKKLEQAWKAHECAASKLCNLIEEVTLRGWKDLYPVVQSALSWQAERAWAEGQVAPSLVAVQEQFMCLYQAKIRLTPQEEPAQVFLAIKGAPASPCPSAVPHSLGNMQKQVEPSDENNFKATVCVLPGDASKIATFGIDEVEDDNHGDKEEGFEVVQGRTGTAVPIDDDNGRRDFFKVLRHQQTTPVVHIGDADSTDVEEEDDDDSALVGHSDGEQDAWVDMDNISPSIFKSKEEESNVEGATTTVNVVSHDGSFMQSKWTDSAFVTDEAPDDESKDPEEPGPIEPCAKNEWAAEFHTPNDGNQHEKDSALSTPTESGTIGNEKTEKHQEVIVPGVEKGRDDPSSSSSSTSSHHTTTVDEKIQIEGAASPGVKEEVIKAFAPNPLPGSVPPSAKKLLWNKDKASAAGKADEKIQIEGGASPAAIEVAIKALSPNPLPGSVPPIARQLVWNRDKDNSGSKAPEKTIPMAYSRSLPAIGTSSTLEAPEKTIPMAYSTSLPAIGTSSTLDTAEEAMEKEEAYSYRSVGPVSV